MSAHLQVRLLGGIQLFYEGKALEIGHSVRLQTLVAYLALHRTAPVSREELAALFWPDASAGQARTNLRNLLHQLRQAAPMIDGWVELGASDIAWRAGDGIRLDVDEFRRRLAAALPGSADAAGLQDALQLYTGDLFPGCYDDWIQPLRADLRQAYLGALERLAALQEEARQYPQALQSARRLAQAEPLQPAAVQRLMRLYSLTGDRPSALKAFRVYARLLKEELDAEPEDYLQEAYLGLQAASNGPSRAEAGNAGPLVGRSPEWRQLLAQWQAAAGGSARAVIISGEAGIGKTRLALELVKWAGLQGIPALSAACYPSEGSLPYAPVMSWLKARPLPPLEQTWLVEIGRLLPELTAKISSLPRLEPLSEAWQRQRLFEALVRAVTGHRKPQIILLEDAQWCDRDTLEWLHFLLRFAPQAPLLVVATLRQGEAVADNHFTAFQSALQAEGRSLEIELRPLAQADALQLIAQTARQLAQAAPDSAAEGGILRQAEGNPLFLVEMVRLGQALPAEALEASGRIQAVLKRRLETLSPATRELTALAATIGREFSLAVLRQASEQSETALVSALDELIGRHIIREISPETYDFTHDLLRQAATGRLSTAHRRLLHRKAAEAYARLDQAAPNPRYAEIGSHYERSGLAAQAVGYYRLAAQAAADIFANHDAWTYFQRAVDLAESAGVGEKRAFSYEEFAVLLEKTGRLLALESHYPQALAHLERALAQPFPQNGLWRSQIYRKINEAWAAQYRHDLARTALEQAEQALGVQPPAGTLEEQQEWLQIQLDRIQLCYWDNHTEQMEALIAQVEAQVASLGKPGQQNNLLAMRYMASMRRERFRPSSATMQVVQQRLQQAETLADPYNLAVAQFHYGFCLLWHGDLELARRRLDLAYEALDHVGDRLWQMRCLAYQTVVSRKLHDPEQLQKELPPLLESTRAMNEPTYLGIGLANQGWLAWQNGDAIQAVRLCEEARSTWQTFNGSVFHALADWVLLAAAASRQDLQAAAAAARCLLDPNPAFQPLLDALAGLLEQGLKACERGEQAEALACFDLALEAARAANEL